MERLITPEEATDDEAVDRAIRPKRLKDYIGQKPMREQMGIFIQAARGRSEPFSRSQAPLGNAVWQALLAGIRAALGSRASKRWVPKLSLGTRSSGRRSLRNASCDG